MKVDGNGNMTLSPAFDRREGSSHLKITRPLSERLTTAPDKCSGRDQ